MTHLVLRNRTAWLAALLGILAAPGEAAVGQPRGDGVSGAVPCENGRAGEYLCQDVDLVAHFPLSAIGGGQGSGAGHWGWRDPETGREYAIVGHSEGTAFVDVTDPDDVTYLGILPPHLGGPPLRSPMLEMSVFKSYLYVVNRALYVPGDGLQIFDLRGLRDVRNPPETFAETAHYAGFGFALGIAINEETGFAYAAGTDTCGSGLNTLSLQDPLRPAFVGCFPEKQHEYRAFDAQCVVYRGPDTDYRGREVCFVSNEDFVSIVDVQDKSAARLIARSSNPGFGIIHQGRLTEDHRYFLQGDEVDERFDDHNTRTYIWDMADLDDPKLVGHHDGETQAIDHRLYVKGNEVHQANYEAGFRMLSLSRIAEDQLDEVAYFDTHPSSDARDLAGAYSSYPFHENGLVTVSDSSLGLFVLRPTVCRSPATPTLRLPPDGASAPAHSPSLDWDDVKDASSYDVEVATDPTFDQVVRSESGLTASAWTVTPGLDGTTTYWWRVRAVSSCSSGAWSPGSSFTTGTTEPDFAISCEPQHRTALRGGRWVTTNCTVSSRNGFAGPVALSVADLTAGDFGWYLYPEVVTPPANGSITSTLHVQVGSSVPTGTRSLRVLGSSGTLERAFGLTLEVVDQPPQGTFSIQCAPTSLTVRKGGTGTTLCTLSSVDGFSGPVDFDCLQLRPGESCSFAPAPVELPSGGSVESTLTLAVPPTSEPEDFRYFYAWARSGPLENGVEIQLHVLPGGAACQDGKAGEYLCKDVDLLAHFPLFSIGGVPGRASGGWGRTDPETGKEYAIVAHSRGTAFIDVTDPKNATYLGLLPTHEPGEASWLQAKVFRSHLYVVGGGGLQIFDLTGLRSVGLLPVTFTETAHYAGFRTAGNLAVDEETGFAYAVGGEPCSAGLHMVSLQDPVRPVFAGCFADPWRGNTARDAQCVVYRGPDADYRGREVCFVPNEEFVAIADVQDKSAPRLIARTSFRDAISVNHGSLTEDHRYYLQGDGFDEQAWGHNTRTYVWDVADLDHPVLVGHHDAATQAFDHQIVVKGNEVHQANTQAGFRMLSLSNVATARLEELAYFDMYPASDARSTFGAFSSYPFHANGLVTVSDSFQGLFVLRPTGCRTPATPRVELPADGASEVPVSPSLDWSDVADATSYEVQLATDARFENVVRSATGSLNAWTVTPSLDRGTTYYWRARAANDCGGGAWSFGSSFTTVANRPPVLEPIGDKTVAEGGALTFEVNASDPDGDALTYTAIGLPPGASFGAFPRTFSWAPTFDQAGSYPGVTFEVSDGRGGTDSEAITITVLDTNRPPVANAGPDQTVPVHSRVTLDGTGSSDPDGDLLDYLWSQVSGRRVSIDGDRSVRATVTLAAPGSYVFELRVSDDGFTFVRDRVTVTATGTTAVYDPVLEAPKCGATADSCDSGELLIGRDGITGPDGAGTEPNQPNTIHNSCADGAAGSFHVDESVDRVKLSTLDGGSFATGRAVKVEVTVFAWPGDPASDKLDLYYAANASSPAWRYITTLTPAAGGQQTLSATYWLPVGDLQAVRARFRYQGAPAPCQTGPYDDHDDLVFAVDRTAAVFDPFLKAPRCWAIAGACDSGDLLTGRDSIAGPDGAGAEPNQPNTINDSCADGTDGVFHVDPSNDRIRVSTVDGGPFAPGKFVRVEATVWARAKSPGERDRLDLYYAADANNPSWTLIKTLVAGAGSHDLSAVYRLPEGIYQAVRARSYSSSSGGPSECSAGPFDDHDDLVFSVGLASPMVVATFDPVLKAPKCGSLGRACDSGKLLVGRDSITGPGGEGAEPNQPNTIHGSCADGTGGRFHAHESLDYLRVSTLDGGNLAPGRTVKIEAIVWAQPNLPSADHLDLYYAADATNPGWTYVTTLTATVWGGQLLSATYTLPVGKLQAVRGRFRHGDYPAPCHVGLYDDHDDLVFSVDHTTAVFDPVLKAPRCAGVAGACDSGGLLFGRDGVGPEPEPNEPNTIGGSCPDGHLGDVRHSSDYIRVSALDGGELAPGKLVKVDVMVWASVLNPILGDSLEVYYAADATNPVWTLFSSLGLTEPGAQIVSPAYTLPDGERQAVRVHFRRGFESGGPCTGESSEHYDDHDDLVFAVRPPPTAEP